MGYPRVEQRIDGDSRTALLVAAGMIAAVITTIVLATMIVAVYKAGQRAEHNKDIATCVQWLQEPANGVPASTSEDTCHLIIK